MRRIPHSVERYKMDHPQTVKRFAAYFFSGTLLSRVTGLLREVVTASCFGAVPAIAAFFVAYRFSQLLRRLFGEGALLAGFNPHYEAAKKESVEKGVEFFKDLFSSLTFWLSSFLLVLEGGLFCFWKWAGLSKDSQEIVYLTMIMLPGVLFICLYALFSAFLQSERRYFMSGAAPAIFNGVLIVALFWVKDAPIDWAMSILSLAVTVAFFCQWMSLFPQAFRLLKGARFKFVPFSPAFQEVIRAIGYTVIGVGAVQINSALDALFARYASLSGPAYLYYAMRLYQLPLSLFGIAVAAAVLPPLSRAIQGGKIDHFKQLLKEALSQTFFLMFPASMAILALGASAVDLIYVRGHFGMEAFSETTKALWLYGVGLVPSVFVVILAPAFYAQKDFRTPLLGSLMSVLFNLGLNGLFVLGFGLGPASIALATSLAAFANAFFLMKRVSLAVGPLFDRPIATLFTKVTTCSVIAAGLTTLIGYFLVEDPTTTILNGHIELLHLAPLLNQLIRFVVLCGFFALIFLSYAYMMQLRTFSLSASSTVTVDSSAKDRQEAKVCNKDHSLGEQGMLEEEASDQSTTPS